MRRPVVLLGEFSNAGCKAMPYLLRNRWGRMWVTKGPYCSYEGEPYGLDNGAYGAWNRGAEFPTSAFLRRLDAAVRSDRVPLLAITPDIVAGGLRSLDFSMGWRDRLPDAFPWYLAVQDGMTPADVAPVIGRFAGVFLGGSDAFKRTVGAWRVWTAARGLPLHWGRCGTFNKLREAVAVGVDSVDSATPVLKATHGAIHAMNLFEKEWLGLNPQLAMF